MKNARLERRRNDVPTMDVGTPIELKWSNNNLVNIPEYPKLLTVILSSSVKEIKKPDLVQTITYPAELYFPAVLNRKNAKKKCYDWIQ